MIVADRSYPRPRVVIIGAGFGGLSAARQLAKGPFDFEMLARCVATFWQGRRQTVILGSLDVCRQRPERPG
jgi:NADH dehydrogenase FAD-containing subunit